MGRNSKSPKGNPVCEKLRKVLAGYPNFIKFRPLSNRQPEQKEDGKGLARSYSLKIHAREENVAATAKEAKVGDEGKKSGEDVNDMFSDYISRAKRRLGSISFKRRDSGSKGKEIAKDDQHFSDYISRAKNKLGATSSSVGWGKR